MEFYQVSLVKEILISVGEWLHPLRGLSPSTFIPWMLLTEHPSSPPPSSLNYCGFLAFEDLTFLTESPECKTYPQVCILAEACIWVMLAREAHEMHVTRPVPDLGLLPLLLTPQPGSDPWGHLLPHLFFRMDFSRWAWCAIVMTIKGTWEWPLEMPEVTDIQCCHWMKKMQCQHF